MSVDTSGCYDWEAGHEWRETGDAAEPCPQLGMPRSLSSDVEEKALEGRGAVLS